MSETIRRALLSKGYFPRELPPAFTTTAFGAHIDDIISSWKRSQLFHRKSIGKRRSNSYSYTLKETEAELISMPKRGYERRVLHITHPLPQALLVWEMSQGWKSLVKWLSRQEYSEDKIQVSGAYERSLREINFQRHRAKIEYIEAVSDWLVKTDITRFYPSIYTHSISWAAYGKECVKSNRKLYDGSLADRLDVLMRSCNRNQTIGIPIGPETSRIIAEIISSRIDSELKQKFNGLPKGTVDRLQDDWVVGVSSLEEAEKVLSFIGKAYHPYGLDINGSKTSIDRIATGHSANWLLEIRSFLSHRPRSLRGARLDPFLKMCLRLQSTNASEPVINYALSVIERLRIVETRRINSADVESMESFLLKAAVLAPNSMDRICRIVLNLQNLTNGVSVKRVADRFMKLTEKNLENGNTYEVIWLLYTLRGLKRAVASKRISEMTEDVSSSAVALILLDMRHKNVWRAKLPKENWESQISRESVLTDWTWLLGYEGIRNGWLSDPNNLMGKPLFKPMMDRGVVFYDLRRNVPQSRSVVAAQSKYRNRDNIETKVLLEVLREIDEMHY